VAVAAARKAAPGWRALTGDKRRDLMFKLAALIEQNSKQLANSRRSRTARHHDDRLSGLGRSAEVSVFRWLAARSRAEP